MQVRNIILGGLLAAGLLSAGCGGPELTMEAPDSLESREDALPYCGNQSYWIDYYADPGFTTWVGYQSCSCYETAWIGGRRTQYAVTDYLSYCAPQPE